MTETPSLRRALSSIDATALVVGTVIGTGVFLKTTPMSQALGSPMLVLAAWAAAGVLSIMGALVYAELGVLFPEAGGEFVYLQKGYGERIAFLYGWQRLWISGPGTIAAYAVGAATFARGIVHLDDFAMKSLAIVFISIFTAMNCLAVTVGGKVQSALTVLKVLLVAGLALAAFALAGSGSWNHLAEIDPSVTGGAGAFGLAMISALWAFDGWNNLPMAAGEVRNPSRVLPLALIGGITLVLGIYAMANLGYFYALPFTQVLQPGELSVAARSAETFMGSSGILFLSMAFVISAVGAMNGSILTGARVPYAMAKEKLLPSYLSKLTTTSNVPAAAVLTQGGLACALALTGTFDMLTDWVIFSSWIFYVLCGFAVVRLRKLAPELARPYRVPFFPVLPVLFSAASVVLLVNTLIEMPKQSITGLVFILAGIPVHLWMRRKSA